MSRRASYDNGDGNRESEVVVLKERRLVPIEPICEGMGRFSFLLEVSAPGSIPDPQLVAAVLDLVSLQIISVLHVYPHNLYFFQPQAPLITRACFLLECAHFVHLCNRGQWPTWIKHNLALYHPSGQHMSGRASSVSLQHKSNNSQEEKRNAGKMFYQVRFI